MARVFLADGKGGDELKKRLQQKWNRPRVYVNDKRFFKPDDMSVGVVRAYAVYIQGGKV